MNVTKRIVNVRRHTLGYEIHGKIYTRYEAVRLAKTGKLNGVKVVRTRNISHLVGVNKSLYRLPVTVSSQSEMRKRKDSCRF